MTVSERGVVFFRKQDGLTNDLQKELIDKLGRLTGKPESVSKRSVNALHIKADMVFSLLFTFTRS